MLVKEIIEMTKEKPIPTIAKEHLTIGEKKLRNTLKAIGGSYHSGQKGWSYEGNPEDLEKSIYEFAEGNKRTGKRKATATKKNINSGELKNESSGEIKNTNSGELKNEGEKEVMNDNEKQQKNETTGKRSSFDIDVEIMKKIKHFAVEEDLKVYEVVEQALIMFVKEKGL